MAADRREVLPKWTRGHAARIVALKVLFLFFNCGAHPQSRGFVRVELWKLVRRATTKANRRGVAAACGCCGVGCNQVRECLAVARALGGHIRQARHDEPRLSVGKAMSTELSGPCLASWRTSDRVLPQKLIP